jgi:hypothetical protein
MVRKKSVAEKMGVKEHARSMLINADREVIDALALPKVNIASRLSGKFDYLHLFTKTQAKLDKQFTRLKKYLAKGGTLWVSWPKGGKLDTDLNLKVVIKIGYDHGLVESKTLSINHTWSAIKFTHPREGKSYNNSYGKLKNH